MFCTWMGLVTQLFKFPVPLSVTCITFLTYMYTWLFCIIILMLLFFWRNSTLNCYFPLHFFHTQLFFFWHNSTLNCYFPFHFFHTQLLFYWRNSTVNCYFPLNFSILSCYFTGVILHSIVIFLYIFPYSVVIFLA